ncbi:MAG: transposase [Paenibacillus sp.]|nr:transposase [Paenibacillus sp.]
MANNKNGNYIKGTKKELPEDWATYGFCYAVFPSKEQEPKLERSFGCERKVYNEYVAGFYEYHESIEYTGGRISYKVPNYTTITIKFDFLDKSNDSFVYNDAKMRFTAAIKKYNEQYAKKPIQYKKSIQNKIKNEGYIPNVRDIKGLPKFHSKKQGKLSYTTNQTNGNISVVKNGNDGYLLRIPKFQDGIAIHLHRELPVGGVVKKATIRREGTKYLVSLSVDFPFKSEKPIEQINPEKVIGLDYSQSELYVDSNGEAAEYPRYHKIIEKRQRRLNKFLARKKNVASLGSEGKIIYSNHYKKTLSEYQDVMKKAKNQRKDFLHKASNQKTNDYDAIVVEDLDLSNLAQCLSLGKKLHDNGFGMYRNMLEYKALKKGKHFIIADKFFPSSKLCSECGGKNKHLKLSDRVFLCPHCGLKKHRDHNAALNLKQYGIRLLGQKLTA